MSQTDRGLEIKHKNEVTNKDNLLLVFKCNNMSLNKITVLKEVFERIYEEEITKLIKRREIGKLSTSDNEKLNKKIVTFTSIFDFDLERHKA